MINISGPNMRELTSVMMSAIIAFSTLSVSSNQIPFADAETVASGECNCILDSTTYASLPSINITGLTIPSVKLLKNETVESATEGSLSWITEKGTELLGILSEDFFLGNFSRGTGKSVALNTLNVKLNESLGMQITGGNTPVQVKAEIIKASVDKNGTLGEIKTIGPKVGEVPIQYVHGLKEPAMGKNSLQVKVPGPGDYLVLVELSFDSKNSLSKPLIAVYETVLIAE
jgi:hypothetical protein